MKKVVGLVALSSLVVVSAAAAISASIAWFKGVSTFDDRTGINGGSQGAYFAGGTGKSNDPYIIKNKWHIYNLAWLTYIGWFDDPNGWGKDNDANEKQPYFVCQAEDKLIDMGGMVIPPIGTSIHPFMGSFNGNNNVIYNFSVSNIWGQADNNLTRKPTTVDSNTLANIDIVGFFGVVGLLPSNVESFPSYSSQKNNITNLGLEDFTIQTKASQNGNLVGLAAGYVNADISGIAVGESNFDIAANTNLLSLSVEKVGNDNIYTKYISHYGTIGYCAQRYLRGVEIRTASAKNPKVEDGTASGGGNLFGNSIPMKDIYLHLRDDVKESYTNNNENTIGYTYLTERDAYYRNDQHTTDPYRINTEGAETAIAPAHSDTISGSSEDFKWTGYKETDSSGYEIASYNFDNRKSLDSYLYIDSERTVTVSNGLTESRYEMTGGYIHDGNGHYLGRNGTNVASVSIDDPNVISWANATGGYLTTEINYTTYYLYSAQTGSLTLSSNNGQRTSWQIKDDMFYNANVGFLLYDGNNWTTKVSYTDLGYKIHNGDNYLSYSNTNIANVTGEQSGAKWIYYDGYLSIDIGNTTYYLYSSAIGSLTLGTGNYKTQWTIKNNKFYNNNRGYIIFDGTNWTTSETLTGLNFLGITISSGNSYFGLNGNSPTVTTQENATLFVMDGNYLRNKNNQSYYITSNGYSTSGTKLTKTGNKLYSTATHDWTEGSIFNRKYYRDYNHTYLQLVNGSWSIGNNTYTVQGSRSWGTTTYPSDSDAGIPELSFQNKEEPYDYSNVTIDKIEESYNMHTQITPRDTTYIRSDTKNATYQTYATYFPLQYKNNYKDIGDTNTGYIVGGNYDDATHGSVRISEYKMGYLWNSLNGNSSNKTATYADNKLEVITKNVNSLGDSKKNGYVRITDSTYNTSHPSMSTDMKALNAMTVNDLGLVKYDSARGYLSSTLSGSSYIYGLHFMNSLISEDNTVYAERAKMGGWEYLPDGTAKHYILKVDEDGYPLDEQGNRTQDKTKYVYLNDQTIKTSGRLELPESAIDFVLTENGYINFFSGTYFSGNNTFFSLHQIFRKTSSSQQVINGDEVTIYDKNQIETIKEIRKIYKNNNYQAGVQNPEAKYIYVYDDGKYSLPNGGVSQNAFITDNPSYATELLFDMSWITDIGSNIVNYACYYFEIPVNEGEFALGSVDGCAGAYLMYLDIGASDKSDDIEFVHEKITNTITTHDIPKGVDFVDAVAPQGSIAYQTVEEGDIGTIIVPKNTAGYKVSFNLSNKVLTCGPPNRPTDSIVGSISQSSYIASGVSMNFNGTPITMYIPAGNTSTVVQNIKTKYTYNGESSTLKKEVTISYTDANGTKIDGLDDDSYSEITPNIDRQTYETSYKLALTPGTNDVYVAFTYHSFTNEEVDVEYLYTYNSETQKYTYIFTFVSPEGGIDIDVDVSTIINDNKYIVVFRGIDDTEPVTPEQGEQQEPGSSQENSQSSENPEQGEQEAETPEDKDQTISATGTYRVRTKVKTTHEEENE